MSTSTSHRTRAAEARRAAADREARLRRLVAWGGGLVVVGLIAAIVLAVVSARGGGEDALDAPGEVVVPAGATADGAIPVGQADAPVTVTVYFDYLCPFCGRFEAANGSQLARLVDDGTARLELRPLSFLDGQSDGSAYSSRTANALATVADGAPEQVLAFHEGLFEQQPEEGTAGLTDEQLAEVARDAGVPDAVVARFGDRTHAGWVADVTERAFDAGITGTPAVLLDGAEFDGDLYTAGPLTDAVDAAAAGR